MTPMDELIADLRQRLKQHSRTLEMLESGELGTGDTVLGSTTKKSIERFRGMISELEAVIAKYGTPAAQ